MFRFRYDYDKVRDLFVNNKKNSRFFYGWEDFVSSFTGLY